MGHGCHGLTSPLQKIEYSNKKPINETKHIVVSISFREVNLIFCLFCQLTLIIIDLMSGVMGIVLFTIILVWIGVFFSNVEGEQILHCKYSKNASFYTCPVTGAE